MVNEIVETGPELRGQLQEAIDNLDMILKHAVRADSIVAELIHQSDVEPTNPVLTDLNALIDEQLSLVKAVYSERGAPEVGVVTDFDPACGRVELFPATFTRALRSVIDNAFIAATLSGKADAQVFLSTSRNSDRITIQVRDNGAGLSPESVERGFEPFYTGWQDGTYTGLGLAIAFQVVTEGHGGSIDLEDDPAGGARVTIHIPIKSLTTE
jgi:signal transduction histidine kinase